MPPRPRPTAAWRYWSRVAFDGPLPLVRGVTSHCHEWTGSRNERGYGTFWLGRTVKAYRHGYEIALGPIPAGLDIDHRCRNRACVRPSHLRAVTHRVNLLASTNHVALRAAQTACHRGHLFDATNTIRAKNGTRKCRTCKNTRARASHHTTTPERTAA
ncbi:HNH endonuclease signature motif containing protein [Streptomyces sp. NBC_01237]|uniref:HNH endonuclease signature motif containing protein n=1 Tax=Streptomyces sp. NBC_01237 TaxID=2903790 RepID=UPI002DD9B48F|nr:HNH endonuclease signature motif containing protein [Streptomyces sp. NBC_01237]WRZ73802.1 HNH endonuclease [Streptomyces sp. NBC_01237]